MNFLKWRHQIHHNYARYHRGILHQNLQCKYHNSQRHHHFFVWPGRLCIIENNVYYKNFTFIVLYQGEFNHIQEGRKTIFYSALSSGTKCRPYLAFKPEDFNSYASNKFVINRSTSCQSLKILARSNMRLYTTTRLLEITAGDL